MLPKIRECRREGARSLLSAIPERCDSARYVAASILLTMLMAASAATMAAVTSDEATPVMPQRLVGNLYAVAGSDGSPSSFLIATGAGHILIDTGYQDRTPPQLRTHLQQLGFRIEDVRILLNSHAHRDHVGGHAQVRRWSGARVLVMKEDQRAVSTGRSERFSWEPSPVDGVLHDGDQVELGDMVLTARHTPGHTRGATTWSFRIREAGRSYDVVIMDSAWVFKFHRLVGNEAYPQIVADFERSLRTLQTLPCDVLLDPHGAFLTRARERRARLPQASTENPLVDPRGCREFIAAKQGELHEELARQRAAQ